MNAVCMYIKGKGKGKWGGGKKGGKGKGKGDDGKGGGWNWKGKGDTKGKGKGFFKGACHGCGEIGHRVADCPKTNPQKKAVNQVGEAPEDDHSWEDEEYFENGGWGYLAAIEACRTPPRPPVPTKNSWGILESDDDDNN